MAARSDAIALIADVIAELDIPAASGLETVRVYALTHADPAPVAKVINLDGIENPGVVAWYQAQAAALLEPAPAFAKQAASVHMAPCWATSLPDVVRVDDGVCVHLRYEFVVRYCVLCCRP